MMESAMREIAGGIAESSYRLTQKILLSNLD